MPRALARPRSPAPSGVIQSVRRTSDPRRTERCARDTTTRTDASGSAHSDSRPRASRASVYGSSVIGACWSTPPRVTAISCPGPYRATLPRSVIDTSTASLLSSKRFASPSSHDDHTGVPMMSVAVSVAAAVSPARGQPHACSAGRPSMITGVTPDRRQHSRSRSPAVRRPSKVHVRDTGLPTVACSTSSRVLQSQSSSGSQSSTKGSAPRHSPYAQWPVDTQYVTVSGAGSSSLITCMPSRGARPHFRGVEYAPPVTCSHGESAAYAPGAVDVPRVMTRKSTHQSRSCSPRRPRCTVVAWSVPVSYDVEPHDAGADDSERTAR